MTDRGPGQVPDPTGVTDRAALVDRLKLLHTWAGTPPAAQLQALGATGSVESFVAACLRVHDWSPAEVAEQVAHWQEALRRLGPAQPAAAAPAPVSWRAVTQELARVLPTQAASHDHPTANLPQVAPAARTGALTPPPAPSALTAPTVATHSIPAPAPAAATQPISAPAILTAPGRLGRLAASPQRRWWALAATVAITLLLISVPTLVLRAGPPATPAAAPTSAGALASPTSGASDPATVDGGGPAAQALAPAATAPPPSTATSPAPAPPAPPATTGPPADQPWSAVVDNSTSGRFRASGNWRTAMDSGEHHGPDFRYASPVEASDPAWFKVDIPAAGEYRVEVWYPAKPDYNDRTPFIVATTSGNQTIHINQQSNGGRWVSLGTFPLAAGDAEVIAVSRWRLAGTGHVVADAVRITQA